MLPKKLEVIAWEGLGSPPHGHIYLLCSQPAKEMCPHPLLSLKPCTVHPHPPSATRLLQLLLSITRCIKITQGAGYMRLPRPALLHYLWGESGELDL